MYLYKKASKRNSDEIKNQLCKASGIKPKISNRPHGFETLAAFEFSNIYIDKKIKNQLNDAVKAEIDESLHKMLKEDFGIVDEEIKEQNLENKYLGNGVGMVGRYKISIGVIEINVCSNRTCIELCS